MYQLSSLQQQVSSDDYLQNKRIKVSGELTTFPQQIIEYAPDVEILDLGNNQLSDLPDNLSDLNHLRILFLTNNVFEHIPKVLAQCEKLEMIAFKSNQVKKIDENCLPESIHWLILTDNEIVQLPNSMGKLTKLKKLALAGNRLTSLPESMKHCTELELVRLSANQLTVIPSWLLQLPKLAWLAFSGNPVSASKESLVEMSMTNLNTLKLEEKIGEGASGIIHRAHCMDSNTHVAVKLFKGDVTSDGYPKDEIYCCVKAGGHENLIRVISTIETPIQRAMVMALIPEGFKNLGLPPSLKTCTRDTFPIGTRLRSNMVKSIGLQLISALMQMHKNQVSHGDVYAHNAMIDDKGSVLFGDFGAATDLASLSADHKSLMERIEVRAFGYLIDDLLQLIAEKDEVTEHLQGLVRKTMAPDVLSRPSFSEIYESLI